MRIAIASSEGGRISPHFGMTRGFAIYQVVDGQPVYQEFRVNTFSGHARGQHGGEHHGHHHSHAPILSALADCDVVIAGGMGRRMYDDLVRSGKQTFITDETAVEQAVGRFLAGSLTRYTDQTCRHGHGHAHR